MSVDPDELKQVVGCLTVTSLLARLILGMVIGALIAVQAMR